MGILSNRMNNTKTNADDNDAVKGCLTWLLILAIACIIFALTWAAVQFMDPLTPLQNL